MEGIQVLHVYVDVALERLPAALWKVAATNLEMNPDAGTLHDSIDATRLVIRGLKDAVYRIETETQYIAVVLRGLTYLPYRGPSPGPAPAEDG